MAARRASPSSTAAAPACSDPPPIPVTRRCASYWRSAETSPDASESAALQPLDLALQFGLRNRPPDVVPDRPDRRPEVRPDGVDHESDEPEADDEEEPRIPRAAT